MARVPPYSRIISSVSRTGLSPAAARRSRRFRYLAHDHWPLRLSSPLLAESRLMSFPPATEMFQFAGFASRTYRFSPGYRSRGGLPHSEIPGSPIARISPGLFAACHVLHRLSVPRHPPDALLLRSTPHPAAIATRCAASPEDTPADPRTAHSPRPGPAASVTSRLASSPDQSTARDRQPPPAAPSQTEHPAE